MNDTHDRRAGGGDDTPPRDPGGDPTPGAADPPPGPTPTRKKREFGPRQRIDLNGMLSPTEAPAEPYADLKPHPLAELFPPMNSEEFEALVRSVGELGGNKEEIVLLGKEILDGRHRLKACLRAGVKPSCRQFAGPETPEQFVLAKNLQRRHLSASQRAIVAAGLANRPPGRPGKTPQGHRVSLAEAAALAGVGESIVQQAKRVLASGDEALVDAVRRGEITVSNAAGRLGLPAGERRTSRPARPGRKASPARGCRSGGAPAVATRVPPAPMESEARTPPTVEPPAPQGSEARTPPTVQPSAPASTPPPAVIVHPDAIPRLIQLLTEVDDLVPLALADLGRGRGRARAADLRRRASHVEAGLIKIIEAVKSSTTPDPVATG